MRDDSAFEVVNHVVLGLVCFRVKGSNSDNELLHTHVNADRRIHLVPAKVKVKVKDGEVKVNGTENKVNDGEVKVNDTENKVKDGDVNVNDTENKVKDGEVKVNDTENKVTDGEVKVNDTENNVKDGEVKVNGTENKVKDDEMFFLRFAVCASRTQSAHVTYAWSVIKEIAEKLLTRK